MATIRYSTNATTWTTVTPSGTNTNTTSGFTLANYASASVNGIVNIGSIIGVTTNLGHVLRSNTSFDQFHYTNTTQEGLTWTTRTSPGLAMQQKSIVFGNNIFLNDNFSSNTLQSSTNGISWTTLTTTVLATARTIAAYGNGIWLSVRTDAVPGIMISTNAISWVSYGFVTGRWDSSTRRATAAAFGNNVFVLLGNSAADVPVTSTNGISWTQISTPTNYPTDYNNLVYGNSEWVAWLNNTRAMLRSTDLVTWTSVTTGLPGNIIDVAYGNGVWVAGANQSNFRRSTDGISWTEATGGLVRFDNTLTVITDIAYGGGAFIAVGWYGTRTRSTDGISWVSNNQGVGGSTANYSIGFGNSIWVHYGQSGTPGPGGGGTLGLSTSEASQTFSSISQLQKLTDNNFGMISSGQLLRSTDMVTFTTQNLAWVTLPTLNNPINNVAFANNTWVAGGNSSISSSTNGITWTTRQTVLNNLATTVRSVVYGNGVWLAGGGDVGIPNSFACLFTSTDSVTWTTRTTNATSSRLISKVDFINNTYIGILNNFYSNNDPEIMTSTDTISWTTRNSFVDVSWVTYVSVIPSGYTNQDIAYGNGIYVLYSGNSNNNAIFFHSTDAITWTTGALFTGGNPDGPSNSYQSTIEYNNGVFVAGGVDKTYSSTNGISWQRNTFSNSSSDIIGLSYGNGIWYASGEDKGRYATSTNGISWNDTDGSPINQGHFITYGNGRWVYATATDGTVFYTSGADIFSSTLTSTGIVARLKKINFTNGLFHLLGETSSFTPLMMRSTNGISWVTTTTGFTSAIEDITYGNGRWLSTDFYQIRESTDSISWISRVDTGAPFLTSNGKWLTFLSSRNAYVGTPSSGTPFNFAKVNLNNLAYGNGIYTAVGNSGAMSTSTDLLSWTTRTSTFGSSNITVVAYGNGIWFAAGAGNQIRTSTDAITWTTRTNNDIAAAAYLDNVWIGTTGNSVQISTDAISWVTSITIPSVGSIIRVGPNNTKRIYSSSSTTLNRMTPFNLGYTPTINKVDLSENKNIYLFDDGYMYVSSSAGFTDALNTQTSDRLLDGAVKSGIYNIVGENAIYRSTNGITWTTISIPSNARSFDTTNTGVTWTTRNAFFGVSTSSSDFTIQVNSVAYGGSVVGRDKGWIAVGDTGKLRRSTDGITWTTQNSTFGTTTINAIAYGNIWIAAGNTGQMRLSTDSVNWTTQNSTFGTSNINALAYNNGLWLAVGSAAIRTSTNGLTWVTVNSTDTNTYSEIAYGGGKWVIAGSSGTVRVSTDTVTWVTGTVANNAGWRGIAYGNGMWVLGGGTSGIPGSTVTQQSTDGITWTSLSMGWDNTGFAYEPGPYAIAYANGVWFAGGAPNYDMYKSTNGVNWLRVATFTPSSSRSPIRSIAYGGGMWVAVGSYGWNPQSFTITSPQLFSNNYPITDIISI